MRTREELHTLIDSLPEGAIDAAHRMLTNLQVWPPPSPPAVEEMRKRMEERRLEVMQRQKPGTISGFSSGGNYNPTKGVGSSSFQYWEDKTQVQETLRHHFGHELRVIERTRVDGQRLVYQHEVSGPGGKHEQREITFVIG